MRMTFLKASALALSAVFLAAACGPLDEETRDEEATLGSDESALAGPLCLGSQAGAYCGNDSMQNASASTLYQCPGPNQAPTSSQVCAAGCVVAPPGVPDHCQSQSGPLCLGSQAGAYCGNDSMQNANASTLYQCPGPNQAPTSSQVCTSGCVVAPPGVPDHCQSGGGGGGGFRLPWHAGTSMQLTQDCNDSCCGDHVGNDMFAWDFANGGAFTVVATRGGTITHLKINSTSGCGTSSCVNNANLIVIDHGDGTQSTYLHLQGFSLKPGISCGSAVVQGQELATAGTTGWSTGIHLHYEVSKVHVGAPTCECAANGQACATNFVPWANFWSSSTNPTVAMSFSEWSVASQCGNRRIVMPASQN